MDANEHQVPGVGDMLRAAHTLARLAYPRAALNATHIEHAVDALGELAETTFDGGPCEQHDTIMCALGDVMDKTRDLTESQYSYRLALRSALAVGIPTELYPGTRIETTIHRQVRNAISALPVDCPVSVALTDVIGIATADWPMLLVLLQDGMPYVNAIETTRLLPCR